MRGWSAAPLALAWLVACHGAPSPGPTYGYQPYYPGYAAHPGYAPPQTTPPPAPGAPVPAPNGPLSSTPPSEQAPHGVDYLAQRDAARPVHSRGKASYYADSLAGNHTASGEIYQPSVVSAAHRTLPFGSIVDVVRDDGRWLRVRINDRGPFSKGRVVDLSRRAAELLGMIEAGVADVTLYLVSKPAP